MPPSESVQSLARQWLILDRDNSTRREIEILLQANDEAELEKRMRPRIAFGTAGLRASMSAGFARMNPLTVLQVSQGLAQYILEQQGTSSQNGAQGLAIVLGYDARHNSKKFARLAAGAFLACGLQVVWFGELVHTPMVPFAVQRYKAAAGVMITASHNPKNDNGYKVYWSNGCQIIPPHDAGISKHFDAVDSILAWSETAVDESSLVRNIYAEATQAYFESIRALLSPLPTVEQAMPFTYTPMHGVGLPFMQTVARMLCRGGSMRVVEKQSRPDPEFPTIPFPNPEEKGALDFAVQEAERNGSTIVIANDPDADRFAAVKRSSPGQWHQFTGNQMGILLASYILDTYQGDRRRLAMLASTVSSRMLASMARKEGFHFRETLTGFKWLGNIAQDMQRAGYDPVFAFEEAIGYMFPSVVWDKDGIAAAAVFLTACQRWKSQGLTPWTKLQQLYRTYGYFEDANIYLISPSPTTTQRVFAAIRGADPYSRPTTVGTRAILRWRDLTLGYDSATADNVPDLPTDPTAQMITCELQDSVVFTARGSGTEPKIKLYIEGCSATSSAHAKALADEVLGDLLREWFRPQEYGLRLAGT